MSNVYKNLPKLIADMLENAIVPDTGQPITSVYGPIKYVAQRTQRWHNIISYLPKVTIDIDPTEIEYEEYDQGLFALIPVLVMVYIPIQDGSLDDESAIDQEDQKADEDIKSVYGQLESVFNGETAVGSVIRQLSLVGGAIPYDALTDNEETGAKVRVAFMALLARVLIR